MRGDEVIDEARAMLADARTDAAGRVALAGLRADALALRIPNDLAPEGEIALETRYGEPWIPVERNDGSDCLAVPG